MNATDIVTLETIAAAFRAAGIPEAAVGTTGGNCHSVLIPLTDGGEVLINDYEGPLSAGDEAVDGVVVFWYDSEGNLVGGLESMMEGVIYEHACEGLPDSVLAECIATVKDTLTDANVL